MNFFKNTGETASQKKKGMKINILFNDINY